MTEQNSDFAKRSRELLGRSTMAVPVDRVRQTQREGDRPSQTGDRRRETLAQEAPGRAAWLTVKGELHQRLLDELDEDNLLTTNPEELRELVQEFVTTELAEDDVLLNESERQRLVDDLLEETVGVGPLAALMADPAVTDILVNGHDRIYIERFGRIEKTSVRFRDEEHLVRIVIFKGLGSALERPHGKPGRGRKVGNAEFGD